MGSEADFREKKIELRTNFRRKWNLLVLVGCNIVMRVRSCMTFFSLRRLVFEKHKRRKPILRPPSMHPETEPRPWRRSPLELFSVTSQPVIFPGALLAHLIRYLNGPVVSTQHKWFLNFEATLTVASCSSVSTFLNSLEHGRFLRTMTYQFVFFMNFVSTATVSE